MVSNKQFGVNLMDTYFHMIQQPTQTMQEAHDEQAPCQVNGYNDPDVDETIFEEF